MNSGIVKHDKFVIDLEDPNDCIWSLGFQMVGNIPPNIFSETISPKPRFEFPSHESRATSFYKLFGTLRHHVHVSLLHYNALYQYNIS